MFFQDDVQIKRAEVGMLYRDTDITRIVKDVVPFVFYLDSIGMEMTVDIYFPPSHRTFVDRNMRHNEAVSLYVSSYVIKQVDVLLHLLRFVVSRDQTFPTLQPRNRSRHICSREGDISQDIYSILIVYTLVVPSDHVIRHLFCVIPRP